jgi:hypothetical protein
VDHAAPLQLFDEIHRSPELMLSVSVVEPVSRIEVERRK